MLGVLLGGAFIRRVQQRLAAYEDIEFGALQGSAGAGRLGCGCRQASEVAATSGGIKAWARRPCSLSPPLICVAACCSLPPGSPQDGAHGGHHGRSRAGGGLRCGRLLLRRPRLGAGGRGWVFTCETVSCVTLMPKFRPSLAEQSKLNPMPSAAGVHLAG